MEYFEEIKKLRKDGKMKQEDLAKKARISRKYLSRIESNGADDMPRVSVIKDIALALGKKIMIIFYD